MPRTFNVDDYEWLKRLFPCRSGQAVYSDSWFYIAQACRREDGTFGSYFRSDTFFVGLGSHRNHWVLVRPTGTFTPQFLSDLKDVVRTSSMSRRVFVKKAPPEFLQQLGESGVVVVSADEYPWDSTAPHDDDTFAEPILQVDAALAIAGESGAHASRLRSKLRQFDQYRSRLSLRSISESDSTAVVRMLVDHFDQDPQNVNAYLTMLETLRTINDSQLCHFVAHIDDVPVGFFAYEILDDVSAGLYASVARREFVGLSESMMLMLLQELSKRHIHLVNLGGSETRGLDMYKRKFNPAFERKNEIAVVTLDVDRRLRFSRRN